MSDDQQQQQPKADNGSAATSNANPNEQANAAQLQQQREQPKQQQKQQQQQQATGPSYPAGYQRPIGQGAPWPPPPYGPHHGMPSAAPGGGWAAGGSYDDGSSVPAAWGGYAASTYHQPPPHQQQQQQFQQRRQQQQQYPVGVGIDGIERDMAALNTGRTAPPKDADFPALSGGNGGGGNGGPSGRQAAPKSWAKIAAGSNPPQEEQEQQQDEQPQQQQQQQPNQQQHHQFQQNKPRALGRGYSMPPPPPQFPQHHQNYPGMFGHHQMQGPPPPFQQQQQPPPPPQGDLDDRIRHLMQSVNPPNLEVPDNSEFYVIKSYSEDDIHRAIKYSIWCSTPHGNSRLNKAYQRATPQGGKVYLLYSVNGSGHFCGVAQMTSEVDSSKKATVWCQDKWQGQCTIAWLLVKDVPNSQLRHIRIVSNENKPVTNSRDCTQVPLEQGRQVLSILLAYHNTTSIFDDFSHYDRRELEGNSDLAMQS